MTEQRIWDTIHTISDVRARYNCFNAHDVIRYRACSIAIRALREQTSEPDVYKEYEPWSKPMIEATLQTLKRMRLRFLLRRKYAQAISESMNVLSAKKGEFV